MRGSAFDELRFFGAIASSGARSLLIGRRALVVLGVPVLTADYDFWLAIEDIEAFNAAAANFELWPSKTALDARRSGRYVLENDERVDVLVARSVTTRTGEIAEFEALWGRRKEVDVGSGVQLFIPSIDDLILTKRFALRPKDVEDIRVLETLREGSRGR